MSANYVTLLLCGNVLGICCKVPCRQQ